MPHRFLNSSCEILFAAMATILVAAGNVLEAGFGGGPTIWDTNQLRMFCLIGAIGGAFVSILSFPVPVKDEGGASPARRMAAKFISSGISGMAFTPVIIKWFGWSMNVDVVLAASAAVALCAVGVLHQLVPLVTRRVIGWFSGTLPECKAPADKTSAQ